MKRAGKSSPSIINIRATAPNIKTNDMIRRRRPAKTKQKKKKWRALKPEG